MMIGWYIQVYMSNKCWQWIHFTLQLIILMTLVNKEIHHPIALQTERGEINTSDLISWWSIIIQYRCAFVNKYVHLYDIYGFYYDGFWYRYVDPKYPLWVRIYVRKGVNNKLRNVKSFIIYMCHNRRITSKWKTYQVVKYKIRHILLSLIKDVYTHRN